MGSRLRVVLGVTTAFEGLRAGAGTFRALLDLPAREQIGALAFAELSRATDLSPTGIVFYAVYGVGGAVLTGVTAIVARRACAPSPIRRATLMAFLCSVAILLLTIRAAPLMWRIGSAPDDPAVLARLADAFVAWTLPRILLADLSFALMVASLVLLAGTQRVVLRASDEAQPTGGTNL